jgi:Holliday junction DNA helicase RuvB
VETNEQPQATNDIGPTVLERFIGQQQAVAKVKVALEACWNDGTAFPHTLLVGPPGLGKTQLAKVIAAETGSQLHEALAQTLSQPADLNALLMGAGDRDVVFIDESDELDPNPFQTLLYRAMEERKLFLSRQGASTAVGSIPLNNFTLLAATNNEFSLVAPLRERFKLVLRFDYYQPDELATVLRHRTTAQRWECDETVFPRIATLGRGVPRLAIRLLEASHRTARSENSSIITADHVEHTCRLEGLDEQYGLDPTELKYLEVLRTAGKPVRVGTLSARLGLPPRTISNVLEAYLLRLGLVNRCEQGRELTPLGIEFVSKQKEQS